MEEQDKNLEAGLASSREAAHAHGTAPRSLSLAGSTTSEADYDKATVPSRGRPRKGASTRGCSSHQTQGEKSRAPDTEAASDDSDTDDEHDHGEPDVDYRDAEDFVPGRGLDRQLSRVRSPANVSPERIMPAAELTRPRSLGTRFGGPP